MNKSKERRGVDKPWFSSIFWATTAIFPVVVERYVRSISIHPTLANSSVRKGALCVSGLYMYVVV